MPLVLLFPVLHFYKTGVKYWLMRNFEFSVVKGAGVHLFQKFLFHTLIKVSVSAQKKKNPNKQTTLEGNSVLHLASYKTSTEAAS